MRLFTTLCLLLIGWAPSTVLGQSSTIEGRTLTVLGEGSVIAPSDRALIFVGLQTEGDTAAEALERHEREVERIKTELGAFGIDDDQMRSERFMLQSTGANEYDSSARTDDQRRSVTQRLVITLDDLDAVTNVVAALAQDGEASLDEMLDVVQRSVDVQYVLQDLERYQNESLQAAIENAKSRAALTAQTAGVSLGEVLTVREQGVFGSSSGGMVEMAEMMATAQAPLLDGERRVMTRIVVVFALEDEG